MPLPVPEPTRTSGAEPRAPAHGPTVLDKPAHPVPPGASLRPVPPAQQVLEQALAQADGGEAAVLVVSGAGALACALLALLRPGDHVIATEEPAGASQEFLAHELPQLGVAISFVPLDQSRAWRRALRPATRLLYAGLGDAVASEAPLLHAPRLLAREVGATLAVGAAGHARVGAQPLRLGADVVVRTLPPDAASVAAGMVCGPEAVVDEVRQKAFRWGLLPPPAITDGVRAALPARAVPGGPARR